MSDRYGRFESSDDQYEDDPYFDDYAPEPRNEYPVDGFARREAALRRRNILFGLVGAVVFTGIGGFLMSTLWMATVLCFILLIAYVGLMAWAATRGSISLSGRSRPSAYQGERHVARAVLDDHGRYEQVDGWDDRYEEYEEYDEPPRVVADRGDDGWWDQPRRAASR